MKYALIGERLGHSYSKLIHEKYFQYTGINASYELLELPKERLSERVGEMISSGYVGFNVTIPYKIELLNMCETISSEAADIGAVNTVKITDGAMHGYNTDYHGLKLALEVNGIDLKGKSCVILGSGGASKAVRTLCRDMNCSDVTIVSRNPDLSDKAYRQISYNDKIYGDIVINTTPLGMYPNTDDTAIRNFDLFEAAVDLIYNPAETLFLKLAARSGLKTVNGLYMLVAQAIYAESIWNDTDMDFEITDRIYNEMKVEI